MPSESMGFLFGQSSAPKHETGGKGDGGTHLVQTTVFALVPEYEQVLVRDKHGLQYALTRRTAGIELGALHEGQRVICKVTGRLPRVLAAQAVA